MSETTENTQPKYVELLESFKAKVAASGPSVIDGVVATLTKAEVEKRQNTVIKALELIQEADKEIKKIKPDQESFDENEKLVAALYSKDQAKKLKEAKDKKAKLDEAINLALSDKPDFTKLNNLVK